MQMKMWNLNQNNSQNDPIRDSESDAANQQPPQFMANPSYIVQQNPDLVSQNSNQLQQLVMQEHFIFPNHLEPFNPPSDAELSGQSRPEGILQNFTYPDWPPLRYPNQNVQPTGGRGRMNQPATHKSGHQPNYGDQYQITNQQEMPTEANFEFLNNRREANMESEWGEVQADRAQLNKFLDTLLAGEEWVTNHNVPGTSSSVIDQGTSFPPSGFSETTSPKQTLRQNIFMKDNGMVMDSQNRMTDANLQPQKYQANQWENKKRTTNQMTSSFLDPTHLHHRSQVPEPAASVSKPFPSTIPGAIELLDEPIIDEDKPKTSTIARDTQDFLMSQGIDKKFFGFHLMGCKRGEDYTSFINPSDWSSLGAKKQGEYVRMYNWMRMEKHCRLRFFDFLIVEKAKQTTHQVVNRPNFKKRIMPANIEHKIYPVNRSEVYPKQVKYQVYREREAGRSSTSSQHILDQTMMLHYPYLPQNVSPIKKFKSTEH